MTQIGRIEITNNTMTCGNRVFQITNISEVRLYHLKFPDDHGQGNSKLAGLGGVATWLLLTTLVSSWWQVWILPAGAVIWFIHQRTRKWYAPSYGLAVQMNGNSRFWMYSPSLDDLEQTKAALSQAMEKRITDVAITYIHNLTSEDTINVFGDEAIGKQIITS